MNLNDLLVHESIDPRRVIVFRHRPPEPRLSEVLPYFASEKPEVFNAYQQTQQTERVENSLRDAEYAAAFVGQEPCKALFVGLYSVGEATPISREEYWNIPAYVEMKEFGMRGWTEELNRSTMLWFDLRLTDFYSRWKGKLIVNWPPPERSWWRRAHKNVGMSVLAILEDSALDVALPHWQEISFTWDRLKALPSRWRAALSQWRGIYYIIDTSDGKGYVGSAYGADNLLGRWQNYGASGHGGNKFLLNRDPRNFRFTILQRVSPDLDAEDVIRLESSWKDRLHTRVYGLNDN